MELVIIVTPRLVRPVPAGSLKVPTDRALPPYEADLFVNGQTDSAVPPTGIEPATPRLPPPVPLAPGGSAQVEPTGFEKDYGHAL